MIVETGIVTVSRGAEKVLLKAGEKVKITKTSTLNKEEISDHLHNYYRSKEFIANNTPLSRVAEVLSEAYETEIILEDPSLKDLRLTTTFKGDSLDTILQVIAETFEIRIERKGRQIILTK